MELIRRFTPFSLLLLSINGMVGSAWLFAPLYSAKIAGTGAIIAWIIGGLATTLIALTFAELSVMFPVPGGSTRIPQVTHGELTGFIIGWIAWLSSLTMAPIEVLAVLQYAATYFPSLVMWVNETPELTHIGLAWATVLMLVLSAINTYSFKGFVRCNFIVFFYKILVIALIISALPLHQFHTTNFVGFPDIFSWASWHDIFAAIATGGIAFAFTGFKHGVELAGEAKNLRVAIPLAIIGSVLCCLLLYLGLQIVFIGALDPSSLTQGWQHLFFKGEVGPFAGILTGLGILWLLKLLYVDAVVSPLGAGLIYMTSTARIIYAMSSNGYFPKYLMKVNQQHMPLGAIALNFVLGMFLFLPFSGWQSMVSFLVSLMVISYGIGPIAVLSLRLQSPGKNSGFKLFKANILCPLAFYCCTLISYWTGWETLSKLAIVIAIGFMVFIRAYYKNTIPRDQAGLQSLYWLVPYFAGLTLISYLGSFGGGKNIITFGWDFLVIAIFSMMVLIAAIAHRLPKGNFEALAAVGEGVC